MPDEKISLDDFVDLMSASLHPNLQGSAKSQALQKAVDFLIDNEYEVKDPSGITHNPWRNRPKTISEMQLPYGFEIHQFSGAASISLPDISRGDLLHVSTLKTRARHDVIQQIAGQLQQKLSITEDYEASTGATRFTATCHVITEDEIPF